MAIWRKVSTAFDGTETWIDMSTGTITTRQKSMADEIAKANRDHEFENKNSKQGTQDHMHLIAEIPTSVYFNLIARGIWQDPDKKAAWLNSPEAAPFRTSEKEFGKVFDGHRRMV